MQCCADVCELPQENSKHPNFEWRGQGRGVEFFRSLKSSLLSTMSQQIFRRLWGLILVGILSGRLREVRPYGIAASHPSLDIINSLKTLVAIETIVPVIWTSSFYDNLE